MQQNIHYALRDYVLKKSSLGFNTFDGDWKPSMSFLFGGLEDAKIEIKEKLRNNESIYKLVLELIDIRQKKSLIVHYI